MEDSILINTFKDHISAKLSQPYLDIKPNAR